MRTTALILLALLASGCKLQTTPDKRPAPPRDTVTGPPRPVDAVFRDGARVDFWQLDTLTWRLNTKTLRQEPGSQKIWARPVDLIAYDRQGNMSARVIADSGTMDRGMRFFRARGHVVGSNHGGMELRTDSIVFDKESDRISTSARVRVKTETGDVLTGRGFRSDAYLNRWEILSDVKGEIRDLNAFPFDGAK